MNQKLKNLFLKYHAFTLINYNSCKTILKKDGSGLFIHLSPITQKLKFCILY